MKKKLIILGSVSLISVIVVLVILYISNQKNKPVNVPSPSPSSQPSPTASTSNLQGDLPNDIQFNQILTDINEQYPWYSKLPIDTSEYHIVYDFNKNKFKIRIKSPMTVDQIEEVTQRALSSLQKIGVKAPINYYILDASGNQL